MITAVCFLCWSFPSVLRSQDVWTAAASIERAIEVFVGDDDTAERMAERLTILAENPVDLNTADVRELEEIPWIERVHALVIVDHRDRNGPFRRWEDLERVATVPRDLLALARPFLQIIPGDLMEPAETARQSIRINALQRLTRRLDLGRGYGRDTSRTTYEGGPARLYSRIEASFKRSVTLAVAAEKDPGERFIWSPGEHRYGYDHIAGHILIEGIGFIETLVIGHFTPSIGRGLALSRGGAIGGVGTIGRVGKPGAGVRPFASSSETGYLRGVGITLGASGLRLHFLSSRRRVDATDSDNNETVTSVAGSGLHRTPSELARRRRIREDLIASAVEWRASALTLGVAGYASRLNRSLESADDTFRRFSFAGDRAASATIYAHLAVAAATAAFEAAFVHGSSPAVVASVTARFGRSTVLALTGRAYPKEFVAPHGSAPGQSGRPQNEFGAWLMLSLRPTRALSLEAVVDQYRFPWPRFGIALPSSGVETLLRAEYVPRPWVRLRLTGRSETREQTAAFPTTAGASVDGVRDEVRRSLRFDLTYAFSADLELIGRLEAVRHTSASGSSNGFLIYDGLRFERGSLSFDARLTFFDVADFAARVYAYERDLRYSFAAPAYSGAGRRYHLMVTYSPGSGVSMQCKYSSTRYLDADRIGTGTEEISGDTVREVRTQLVLRL